MIETPQFVLAKFCLPDGTITTASLPKPGPAPLLPKKKYLVLKHQVIELTQDGRGLYCDEYGTVYGIVDDDSSLDKEIRIGIWPFIFPAGTPLDVGVKQHDYFYSCPAYQYFHTREEADRYLFRMEREACRGTIWQIFCKPFYYITRTVGGVFWENERTR